MERAHHSSRAGCSRRRTEAHRIASSAGLRVPRVSWQVRLSLLYLWYAAAIGRSWTGRAPVVPRAKGSAWREVTLTHYHGRRIRPGHRRYSIVFCVKLNRGGCQTLTVTERTRDVSPADKRGYSSYVRHLALRPARAHWYTFYA